jgi:hypothetical protein
VYELLIKSSSQCVCRLREQLKVRAQQIYRPRLLFRCAVSAWPPLAGSSVHSCPLYVERLSLCVISSRFLRPFGEERLTGHARLTRSSRLDSGAVARSRRGGGEKEHGNSRLEMRQTAAHRGYRWIRSAFAQRGLGWSVRQGKGCLSASEWAPLGVSDSGLARAQFEVDRQTDTARARQQREAGRWTNLPFLRSGTADPHLRDTTSLRQFCCTAGSTHAELR